MSERLKPFESDGCSVVGPILNFFGYYNDKIRACCIEHDKWYHAGGNLEIRKSADAAFRECLSGQGYPKLSWIMWAGVRLFGRVPGKKFKWGYGRI